MILEKGSYEIELKPYSSKVADKYFEKRESSSFLKFFASLCVTLFS